MNSRLPGRFQSRAGVRMDEVGSRGHLEVSPRTSAAAWRGLETGVVPRLKLSKRSPRCNILSLSIHPSRPW